MEAAETREGDGQVIRLFTQIESSLRVLLQLSADNLAGAGQKSKEQEELDQVAGNAEDEIGERIAGMREHELLYGSQALLAKFGPMLVHICGSPHKFKVRLAILNKGAC